MIELMVIVSIIFILLSIAIPMYSRSVMGARERALRSDLTLMRDGIWKYTIDKQKGPQGLDELKQAGYLKEVPVDPITHERNWEVTQEEVLFTIDQQDPGIVDVHSASNNSASDGTTYSSW